MEDVQILGSRRSYDYRIDDIRLSWLCNRPVIQHIEQAFAFEFAAVTHPMESFGPVEPKIPPGLVFQSGVAPFPEGSVTPVRFIHIEPSRIVIDVAGPTSVIDSIFESLLDLVGGVRTSDDKPAIPSPRGLRDYSQIRFRAAFPPEALVPPGAFDLIGHFLQGNGEEDRVLVPSIEFRFASRSEPYRGSGTPEIETLVLDLRAGTTPEEGVFFSGGPIDSEAHLNLLVHLESILTDMDSRSTTRKKSLPRRSS